MAHELPTTSRPENTPGISRLCWVKAKDLQSHPSNWRTHPQRQLKALRASVTAHGYAGVLLWNERTGRLIDGHARRSLDPEAIVPVAIGSWSEEQEKALLLTLDPISAMAESNVAALRALTLNTKDILEGLTRENSKALRHVLASLEDHAELAEHGAPSSMLPPPESEYPSLSRKKGARTPATIYNESVDSLGPTTLKTREELSLADWQPQQFDIPSLREDKLASIPASLVAWVPSGKNSSKNHYLYIYGTGSQGINWKRTLIATYTDDRRFESCWNSPHTFTQRLLNLKVKAVLGPNFSMWEGLSRAEELYQIFRTRWVCRYWQEAGLNVIPDIQLGNLCQQQGWEYRFIGIPKILPAISINIQTPGQSDSKQFFASARVRILGVLQRLQPKQLLLYHGTRYPENFLEEFPKCVQVVPVLSHMGSLLDQRSKQSEEEVVREK